MFIWVKVRSYGLAFSLRRASVPYSPRLSPLEDRELLSPLFPATTLLAAGEIADQALEGFNYMYGPSVMADETDV